MAKGNNGDKITIITDPFNKEKVGLTPFRGAADIVLVSHDHFDHNNIKSISGDPFCIDGPGEYDIKGVFIRGVYSFHDEKMGKERGINTIYVIGTEDIRVCHLGDFGEKELSSEQLDQIGDVDILIIPVGGVYTINGTEAVKIINQIEPKIVIPMHYQTSKFPKLSSKLNSVDKFLDEIGKEKETVEELSIQKKDLIDDKMKIVVMKCLSK
ncbi:MBL fold metallo-hydrolase [Patescibacteria group bacterium]|nr:MBL fold metallo-hydrolase [Patescibacteria group bacterium]MBU3922818.1 MBL fold metallo-hydrolase [Patescibacteria group bacterium]